MSYFDSATDTISSMGDYGDDNLQGEEFNRSDRSKRISRAADSLCDFVHEHILEARGEEVRFKHFTQDDLDMIARMIAQGMMRQFEHDLEAEHRYLAYLEEREQDRRARLPSIPDWWYKEQAKLEIVNQQPPTDLHSEETEHYISEMRQSFRNRSCWFAVVTNGKTFHSYEANSEAGIISLLNELEANNSGLTARYWAPMASDSEPKVWPVH